MNKKIVTISVGIILILIFSIIIFFVFINDQTDEINENNGLIIDYKTLFIGKWEDLFYYLDDNSYSTWEFYENDTIKNITTGLSYDGSKSITKIKWHEFKLEDTFIYLKFEPTIDYKTYSYVFTNSNNHFSLYDINDILGIPMISFNRIRK